jgi:hypothetical protein
VESKQVRKLRFTSSMGNLGPGPLEVRPADADPGDCVKNGGRSALQAVFRDADGNGVFRRTLDRHARLRSVGCIRHHPTHEHWHLDDFSRYTLRRESTGITVARAHKVSFCLLDSVHRLPSLPGSPRAPHYYGCSSTSPQGISVGWADVYPSGLPGQSLDVTGIPAGMYCLEVTADPRDRLNEASELNNVRGLRVRVLRDSVEPTPEPCRSV